MICPSYSALHVNGVRSYKLARQGSPVELPPRPVQIDAIQLLAYTYPQLTLQVACHGGTYMRSLVRDLGRDLSTCATLSALIRTQHGPFHQVNAIKEDADLFSMEQHGALMNVLAEGEALLLSQFPSS